MLQIDCIKKTPPKIRHCTTLYKFAIVYRLYKGNIYYIEKKTYNILG